MDYVIRTNERGRNVIFRALKDYKAYEDNDSGVHPVDVASAVRKVREHILEGHTVKITMSDDEIRATKRALIRKDAEDKEAFGGMTPAGYAFLDVTSAKPVEAKEKKSWGTKRRR